MRAAGLDAAFGEKPLTPKRGAWDKAVGVAEGQLCDIERVESINVFSRIDGCDDGALVDVRGWGGLDEDAVDSGIVIELMHEVDQRFLTGGRGQLVLHRMHAEFLAHPIFGADIRLRRGILADQHHGQTWGNPFFLKLGDGSQRLLVDLFRNGFSVDEVHEGTV